MKNKTFITIAGTLAAAILCVLFLSALFAPKIRKAKERIGYQEKVLAEYQGLLASREDLEKQWETKKNFFVHPSQPEEVLNAWLKDLLSYAQSQSLTMDKLEPAGIKESAGGKETAVFMSFQGDIRKAAAFLYHLIESDPLVRVESFFVRQEENSQKLSYEIMLGKPVQ